MTRRPFQSTLLSNRPCSYSYGNADGLNPVRETVGATTVDLLAGLGIDKSDPHNSDHRGALPHRRARLDGRADGCRRRRPEATMTGGSTNELRYTGRENDGTELVYCRARYYHPERFSQM
jgi:hypothetical protein